MAKKRKTPDEAGFYFRDSSGLYHFHPRYGASALKASKAAIKARPPRGVAWFWFQQIPTPIFRGDGWRELLKRSEEWREAVNSRGALLSLLKQLAIKKVD